MTELVRPARRRGAGPTWRQLVGILLGAVTTLVMAIWAWQVRRLDTIEERQHADRTTNERVNAVQDMEIDYLKQQHGRDDAERRAIQEKLDDVLRQLR